MATVELIEAVKALSIEEQRHIVSELTEHLESLEPTDITPEQAAIFGQASKIDSRTPGTVN